VDKQKTSPFVYIVLIAVIAALGIFMIQRHRHNVEDRKQIDRTLKEMDRYNR
jgi:hypothetical protein